MKRIHAGDEVTIDHIPENERKIDIIIVKPSFASWYFENGNNHNCSVCFVNSMRNRLQTLFISSLHQNLGVVRVIFQKIIISTL